MINMPMREGWVCPKCGRVLAPNTMYCLWCCEGVTTTTTTADYKTEPKTDCAWEGDKNDN